MSRVGLARYRIEKAREILEDAEGAFKRGRHMLSVNRSYYVCYVYSSKGTSGIGRKGFQQTFRFYWNTIKVRATIPKHGKRYSKHERWKEIE